MQERRLLTYLDKSDIPESAIEIGTTLPTIPNRITAVYVPASAPLTDECAVRLYGTGTYAYPTLMYIQYHSAWKSTIVSYEVRNYSNMNGSYILFPSFFNSGASNYGYYRTLKEYQDQPIYCKLDLETCFTNIYSTGANGSLEPLRYIDITNKYGTAVSSWTPTDTPVYIEVE